MPEQQRIKMRRGIVVALPLFALLYIAMREVTTNDYNADDRQQQHVRSLLHAEPSMSVQQLQIQQTMKQGQIVHQDRKQPKKNKSSRPAIYTFYQLKRLHSSQLDFGNKKHHEDLLNTWEQLWKRAGWEPRVLTLEDAQRHPDYTKYSKALVKSPNMTNVYQGGYDHLCFVRWLAMATVAEGGWMSDYDTMPMGITVNMGLNLPNNGEFTSYSMHVPALLSGTHSEWERMAQNIMTTAIQPLNNDLRDPTSPPPQFYSDMYALLKIKQTTPQAFHCGIPSYSPHENLVKDYPYKSPDKINCNILEEQGILAVHLSHSATERAIRNGDLIIPRKYNHMYRDLFAKRVYRLWREQCHPKDEEILGRTIQHANRNNVGGMNNQKEQVLASTQ